MKSWSGSFTAKTQSTSYRITTCKWILSGPHKLKNDKVNYCHGAVKNFYSPVEGIL